MAGRPRLPIGTYGDIRAKQYGTSWRAYAQYRYADGVSRQVSASGPTSKAAERNLRDKLARLSGEQSRGRRTIRPNTRITVLADEYFARKQRLVDAGDLSPNTLKLYRGHYRNHIKDALGELAIAEVEAQMVDQFLIDLRSHQSASVTATVRAVISGMLGIATRYKIFPTNPVRDAERIPSDAAEPARALEPAEAVDLWEKLTVLSQTVPDKAVNNRRYRQTACDPDLPDLVLWMLGTSDRIGNALAVHWPWIDLEDAAATLGPNVIRVSGEGLRLNYGTTKTREAVLDLPEPVVAMLLMRKEKPTFRATGPVFPDKFGGLRDPSNTSGALRKALDAIGYEWVTSHVFRKTVATVLDDANLSARHVADQLRHARPSMTQDKYMKRGARNPRAKAALEAMFGSEAGQKVVSLR